jgi:carboxyl-terminal processing protease
LKKKTVSEIVDKKAKGILVDLRDNPGGYLEGAVYLASEFLPKGTLIVRQESTTYSNKDYRSIRDGRLKNIPVVILINKGSASASEIFAGALRDHKRATLVGEKSFGKGSVQEALDLKESAGLHLTVAKWILPNGDWINGKGLDPEIKVVNEISEGNTLTKENDRQLEKAIEILLK